MHVLVAEDDVTLRHMIGILLSRRNIPFSMVENGEQAVEAWQQGGIDLILMDIQMPMVDGLVATKTIREKEQAKGGHVTIVAMTAHAMNKDRDDCLKAGMDDYVTKPIDFKTLIATIEKYADKR